jgi:sugar lactone lactonase YvrE
MAVSSNYGLTTTVAGTGSPGDADGIGTAASFKSPIGIAVDASGNIYVADINNHKIRKITEGGVVSTLAGGGPGTATDDIGTGASFNNPSGVAVDALGNIYVADFSNNKIRKITPLADGTCLVSTLAGSGLQGADDGIGTAASFKGPNDVAVDAFGNIYVADYLNNKIRRITATGVVSTLAGSGSQGPADGIGTAASFDSPSGVAVDASGNVYVADFLNNKIRKITATGVVSTLAGNGLQGNVDGPGSTASFNRPNGIAIDASGNLYVTERENHKVRKITATGVVSTLAGNGSVGASNGIGTAASFNIPYGIDIDASGNLYVGELGGHKIRKILAQ